MSGFDSLYANEAESIFQKKQARRPDLIPEPKIGVFAGFWKAAAEAVPAAGIEMQRAMSPVLDAYGKAAAYRDAGTVNALTGQTPPDSAQLKRDTIDRMGDNELGVQLGREAKRYAPDPNSTGVAAQIVHGVGKVVGKALGYGALGGLPGAVIGTGLDEGVNRTQDLTDQGVPLPTAAKAGAVHGVATSISIALPVAGKTLTQTAGLALASGPTSFMAENAAIQHILEKAGHEQIAQQFDPFDPVGLSVATIAPLLFGGAAHVARGVKAKTAPAPDTPLAPTARITDDQVAAARTLQMARAVDESSLAARDDFTAQLAHADALDAAGRALDSGRAIDSTAVIPDQAKLTVAAPRMQGLQEALEARAVNHAPMEDIATTFKAADAPSTKADASPGAESIDLSHAREIVMQRPDLPVYTGAMDEQGNPVTQRAADLMADLDADAHLARIDRQAFQAAVNCFLRNP